MQFSLRYIGLLTIAVAAGLTLGLKPDLDWTLVLQGTAAVLIAAILIAPQRHGLVANESPGNVRPVICVVMGWTLLAALNAHVAIRRQWFGELPQYDVSLFWTLSPIVPSIAWEICLLGGLTLLRTYRHRSASAYLSILAAISITALLAIGFVQGSSIYALVEIAIRGVFAYEPAILSTRFASTELDAAQRYNNLAVWLPAVLLTAAAVLLTLRSRIPRRWWWTLFTLVLLALSAFSFFWFGWAFPRLYPELSEGRVEMPLIERVGVIVATLVTVLMLASAWTTTPQVVGEQPALRRSAYALLPPAALCASAGAIYWGQSLIDLVTDYGTDLELLLYCAYDTGFALNSALLLLSLVIILQVLRRRSAPFEQIILRSDFLESAAIIVLLIVTGIPAIAHFGLCFWMGPMSWRW